MAVRTREDILNLINERIGDDSSDEALALIEDVTDTFSDLENRANGDGENWKQKYEDNDKEWRRKYRERFFNTSAPGPEQEPEQEPEPKKLTYDSLFKKGE